MKATNLCVDDDEKITGRNFPKVVAVLSSVKKAIFLLDSGYLALIKEF